MHLLEPTPSASAKRVISEEEFRKSLFELLEPFRGHVNSVTGPGRSGAVASVYASHYLRIPFIPAGGVVPVHLLPVLIVDTAIYTGSTIRKMRNKLIRNLIGNGECDLDLKYFPILTVFNEPPLVKFWYESVLPSGKNPLMEKNHDMVSI